MATLGNALRQRRYEFTCVSPSTHRVVYARSALATSLRDVFGWNLPFRQLEGEILSLLTEADAIEHMQDGSMRSRVRFATVGGDLFVHSCYPTLAADSVFFGPDTYRFIACLRQLKGGFKRAVDLGAGSGAGGLALLERAERITLADISQNALAAARTNCTLAGTTNRVTVIQSDLLDAVEGEIDLIIANPPFMMDQEKRIYRDGGTQLGTELAARIAYESMDRLSNGGTLLLYTGAPIVAGEDVLKTRLAPLAARANAWSYREIDPDIFGDELAAAHYNEVERLAAVVFILRR